MILHFKWQNHNWKLFRIYQRIQRYMEGEVGIEMHDFANISAKTIVYAVLDDFSGNTLMGPTVPNQYRNVKTEKSYFKKTCDYWC